MSVDIEQLAEQEYKYGFVTDIEQDIAPKGLNEGIIRMISAKKNEPEWLLEWRLDAYKKWLKMEEPKWPNVKYPPIDFNEISYYAAPKVKEKPKSLDEIDPELRETYDKLGIPLEEQKMLAGVAVDAVFDSVSVITTFKEKLAEEGVIFCSISEAVKEHPELIQKYMGYVVPQKDNFYAALNSAVFTDGSFVYIPKGVRCPMELSTYFRINAENKLKLNPCAALVANALSGCRLINQLFSRQRRRYLGRNAIGARDTRIGGFALLIDIAHFTPQRAADIGARHKPQITVSLLANKALILRLLNDGARSYSRR